MSIEIKSSSLIPLSEATALEIYNTKFKTTLNSPDTYLSLLSTDPTSIVQQGISIEDTLEKSRKGNYTDWIVRQYLKAPDRSIFISEDLKSLTKALEIYKKLTQNKESQVKLLRAIKNSQLEIKNPFDINSYTRETLLTITSEFLNQDISTLARKKEDNIKVIYEDATWQVIIPLTYEASVKYGTGTNWCTALPSEDYHYNSYSKSGPLLIIKNKKKEKTTRDCKWQYHKSSNQFRTYTDASIGIYTFLSRILDPTKNAPEEIKSATNLFQVLQHQGWDCFDIKAITDKVEYDYEQVNKAIENVKDISLAKIRGPEQDKYDPPYSLIEYACIRENIDLLTDLLNLSDVIWLASDLFNSLVYLLRSKKEDTTDLFKLVLKRIRDKPSILLSSIKGLGYSPIVLCMLKGYFWLNSCLEVLSSQEQRQVLLYKVEGYRSLPFYLAMGKGGRGSEEALAEEVDLIFNVLKSNQVQEASLKMPKRKENNYFLLKVNCGESESILNRAIYLGLVKIVDAIEKTMTEEEKQELGMNRTILATFGQILQDISKGVVWNENTLISSKSIFIYSYESVSTKFPTVPLFSSIGIYILGDFLKSNKKSRDLYKQITSILVKNNKVAIQNIEKNVSKELIEQEKQVIKRELYSIGRGFNDNKNLFTFFYCLKDLDLLFSLDYIFSEKGKEAEYKIETIFNKDLKPIWDITNLPKQKIIHNLIQEYPKDIIYKLFLKKLGLWRNVLENKETL